MCALEMLENDSYVFILLGYWEYERWNSILCFLELINFVFIVSVTLRISDILNSVVFIIFVISVNFVISLL